MGGFIGLSKILKKVLKYPNYPFCEIQKSYELSEDLNYQKRNWPLAKEEAEIKVWPDGRFFSPHVTDA